MGNNREFGADFRLPAYKDVVGKHVEALRTDG